MKVGLTVFFIALAIGTIGGGIMLYNTQARIHESQDLVLGLTYFMEANGGRMPKSADEFVKSPFVERLETAGGGQTIGPIRVKAPTTSRFRTDVHQAVIRDLGEYKIAWGVDPAKLIVDAKGELRDANGAKVQLFVWPDKSWAANEYGSMLMKASLALREPAQSQPAGG